MSNLKRGSLEAAFLQPYTAQIILHVFGSRAKRVLLGCIGNSDWQDDLSNLGDKKQCVCRPDWRLNLLHKAQGLHAFPGILDRPLEGDE